jgi:hypothetical protein
VTNCQTFEKFLPTIKQITKSWQQKKLCTKDGHSKQYDARIDVNIGVGHM